MTDLDKSPKEIAKERTLNSRRTAPPKVKSDIGLFELAAHGKDGERFIALYNGRNVFSDRAVNLTYFCNCLALYSRDPEQIVRVVKSSGLYDKARDWGGYYELVAKHTVKFMNEAVEKDREQRSGNGKA